MNLRTGINLAKELNKLSRFSKIPSYAYKSTAEDKMECCDKNRKEFIKTSGHHTVKNEDHYVELKYLVISTIAIATSAALVGFVSGTCTNKRRGFLSDLF